MKRLSIVGRLALLALVLTSMLAAVGGVGVRMLLACDEQLRENYIGYTVPLVDLGEMLSDVQHARALLSAGLGGENSAVSDAYYRQVEPAHQRALATWQRYRQSMGNAPEVGAIDAALTADREAATQVLSFARSGSFEDAMDLMRADSARRFDALRDAVIHAMQAKRADGRTAFEAAAVANASARHILMGSLVLGLGLAIGMTVMVTRRVRTMLFSAVDIARAVASGDLGRRIDTSGTDETAALRTALHDMQHSLRSLVHRVKENCQRVSHGSDEIALGNQNLSIRTEQTSSTLEQTSSSVQQLHATVQRSNDSALRATLLATHATEVAERGGNVVGEVIATMKTINDGSRQISDITSVIDSIAFQTNILALNAAVEAARAGEQGRGFAVVAAEVRTLAQRSAQAAKEIKTLISSSMERVERGSTQVDQAGQTMDEVVRAIAEVREIVSAISGDSQVQRDGMAHIERIVRQIDQNTQQNAALVEQSAAAAESLKAQAHALVETVSVFRLDEHSTRPA